MSTMRFVDAENKCGICAENHNENFTLLACGHELHTPCYQQMYDLEYTAVKCPVCRHVHVYKELKWCSYTPRRCKMCTYGCTSILMIAGFIFAIIYFATSGISLNPSPEYINKIYDVANQITTIIQNVTYNDTLTYTYIDTNSKQALNQVQVHLNNEILDELDFGYNITTYIVNNHIYASNSSETWFRLNSVNPILALELETLTRHKYDDTRKTVVNVVVVLAVGGTLSGLNLVVGILRFLDAYYGSENS